MMTLANSIGISGDWQFSGLFYSHYYPWPASLSYIKKRKKRNHDSSSNSSSSSSCSGGGGGG